MAEVQPKPAGAVDRVKGKLREVFTPTGRAEVMAQKQIEAILVQVPEDKRVEAMELLESKRPEFVAGKMEDAKGSLVRDAVIVGTGVAVFGGGALVLNKSERARRAVSRMGSWAAESGVGKAVGGVARTGKDKTTDAVNWILGKNPRDYGTKMATGVAGGLLHAYKGYPGKPEPGPKELLKEALEAAERAKAAIKAKT